MYNATGNVETGTKGVFRREGLQLAFPTESYVFPAVGAAAQGQSESGLCIGAIVERGGRHTANGGCGSGGLRCCLVDGGGDLERGGDGGSDEDGGTLRDHGLRGASFDDALGLRASYSAYDG